VPASSGTSVTGRIAPAIRSVADVISGYVSSIGVLCFSIEAFPAAIDVICPPVNRVPDVPATATDASQGNAGGHGHRSDDNRHDSDEPAVFVENVGGWPNLANQLHVFGRAAPRNLRVQPALYRVEVGDGVDADPVFGIEK
jgi:hypothetical protein